VIEIYNAAEYLKRASTTTECQYTEKRACKDHKLNRTVLFSGIHTRNFLHVGFV